MTYEEIKDLAKAAATAYIMGAHIQDPKLAVDKFMEAYNYSLRNSLDAVMQEKTNMQSFIDEKFSNGPKFR